ncbi:MAG TPA: hypothetical protein VFE62_09870 [Gemmataceae bacterium]|nr:hypothetical protein [Gemmataceae bacterium]
MPSTRIQTVLRASAFLGALGVIGFALQLTLPADPRFALKQASAAIGVLAADGSFFTTVSIDETRTGLSLDTWDASSGTKRDEFFRGLIGIDILPQYGVVLGAIGAPDQYGFSIDCLRYSADRRFCALTHRKGLAIADLATGQEWPMAFELPIVLEPDADSTRLHRIMSQLIATKDFSSDGVKWKDVVKHFREKLSVRIVVSPTLARAAERKRFDVNEVKTALVFAQTEAPAWQVLESMVHQLGDAVMVQRRDHVEVTTREAANRWRVCPPQFSPRGTMIVLPVIEGAEARLHIVECATGKHVATLRAHPQDRLQFGFTPDEGRLYYFASVQARPVFTMWDTRLLRSVGAIQDAPLGDFWASSRDGNWLLCLSKEHGAVILDFETETWRTVMENDLLQSATFSPDSRTLVCQGFGFFDVWDVASRKHRGRITMKGAWAPPIWNPHISADSRVLCGLDWNGPSLVAWDLQSCKRLWPLESQKKSKGYTAANELALCTPDYRYVIASGPSGVAVLDPASGEEQSEVWTGEDAKLLRCSGSSDSRSILSYWELPERKWPAWLAKWLPAPTSTRCAVVSSIPDGKILFSVSGPGIDFSHLELSADGSVLLTSQTIEGIETICCWNVPGRPSLWYVLGIPAGIGCSTLLIRWWLRKRRMRQEKSLV